MSESASSGALVRTNGRAILREQVERRRTLVREWYFIEGVTQHEIVQRLAKLKPPIKTTQPAIARDVDFIRAQFRTSFGNRDRFRAEEYIAKHFERCEINAKKALDMFNDQKLEVPQRLLALRLANETMKQSSELLIDCGLLGEFVGQRYLPPPTEDVDTTLPTASEIAKIYDSVNVKDGELVSEAENAWKYGDAAASQAAAMSADDGQSTNVPAEADTPRAEDRAGSGRARPAKIPRRARDVR